MYVSSLPLALLASLLALPSVHCSAPAAGVPAADAPTADPAKDPGHASGGKPVAASDDALLLGDARGIESGWLEYLVDVPTCGRWNTSVRARNLGAAEATVWVEDYVGNPDGRTYDITGPIAFAPGPDASDLVRSGSPLDAREHRMRVHFSGGPVAIEELSFSLRVPHALTPATLVQNTDGDAWTLVWSDEFDVDGHPDESKWTSDVGDWGWGNKEPQEYTHGRLANARCEDGLLHITAVKDDAGHWTSARLTTRGKQSFLYGKIDIRAKVPVGDGAWAAGWLLGDAYRDEVSWPYCGEIDVMEAVGREIDDETGDGINHGSCHTRAYYFKQGNHISSTLDVESMGAFHTYTVEWTPDAVKMLVDGHHYYTYDKTANELEWPFAKPQNVILNLAMGGGMGQAIDPSLVSQEVVVDHVRVYGRR